MVRDGEPASNVITRNFGYCEVLWEIENFLSATCKKDWIISSPEFTVRGSLITKWRLFLKPMYKKDRYAVHIYLERAQCDSFPGIVLVKWKLLYVTGHFEHGVAEGKGVSDGNTFFKTEIQDIDAVEKKMGFFSSDPFSIRCAMIVYEKDSARYDIAGDAGLKSLSQDMAVLYRLNKKSDIVLLTGRNVHAHTAILCSRNRVLKSEITKKENYRDYKAIELDFAWVEPEAAESLMAFLYTANLDYVLRTPSFSMHDLVNYFKINELKIYFAKDELTIRTTYDTQQIEFRWIIPNILTVKENTLSPEWKVGIFDASFQLQLEFDETDKISVFGDFVHGAKPKEIHLACAIFDEKDTFRNMKCMRWTAEECEKLGFEDFIAKDDLYDPMYHTRGNLAIICKLKIPSGKQRESFPRIKTCSPSCLPRDYHYQRLSKDLEILFEGGAYSDLEIKARSIHYKVHRVVLSTRSHVFDKMIKDLIFGDTLFIADVDPYTLRVVLQYIYSGTLRDHSLDYIKKIYAAAEKFSILTLKYSCSQILQDKIESENVLEILLLAYESKDFKLRLAAFKFICCNSQAVQGQTRWLTFVVENPAKYKDYLEFSKK